MSNTTISTGLVNLVMTGMHSSVNTFFPTKKELDELKSVNKRYNYGYNYNTKKFQIHCEKNFFGDNTILNCVTYNSVTSNIYMVSKILAGDFTIFVYDFSYNETYSSLKDKLKFYLTHLKAQNPNMKFSVIVSQKNTIYEKYDWAKTVGEELIKSNEFDILDFEIHKTEYAETYNDRIKSNELIKKIINKYYNINNLTKFSSTEEKIFWSLYSNNNKNKFIFSKKFFELICKNNNIESTVFLNKLIKNGYFIECPNEMYFKIDDTTKNSIIPIIIDLFNKSCHSYYDSKKQKYVYQNKAIDSDTFFNTFPKKRNVKLLERIVLKTMKKLKIARPVGNNKLYLRKYEYNELTLKNGTPRFLKKY